MQRNVVHINYATYSVCRMYVCNNIWIYEYNYRIILYICDHVCVCMNIQYIIVHCGSLLWTCHVTGVPARKSRPVACSSDIPTRILRSCWIPKPSYCKSWGVPSHLGFLTTKRKNVDHLGWWPSMGWWIIVAWLGARCLKYGRCHPKMVISCDSYVWIRWREAVVRMMFLSQQLHHIQSIMWYGVRIRIYIYI